MKGIIRRLRPSPAMVVACIALVFAMTGAGYAAGMLGPNTVGTKQLKKNAVISSKVKNGSLLKADFKAGQVPAGPAGPAGAPGTTGPRGPSDSYEIKLAQQVGSTSNVSKTITLSVPAGSYAISGKALLGTTAGSARETSGQCILTAGADSDYSFERLTDGWYGHMNTQLVHTFAAAGTVTMACVMFGQDWVLGQGSPDTSTGIVAVRTDTATVASGAGTTPNRAPATRTGTTG